MDAGIVDRAGRPACVIAAYTHDVRATMPDGLPGFAAATDMMARLSRTCWDMLDS